MLKARFERFLPGCCSVGIAYHVNRGWAAEFDLKPKARQQARQHIKPTSNHFIWIGRENQKTDFDALCKYHTCVSATRTTGGHGMDLAICVFKWGKK
jgi:hypothetical protein